jgi:hypothetical protein
LVSAYSGPIRILWKASGTGTVWATILLGASGAASDLLIGKVTAFVEEGKYTVDIYTGWGSDFTLPTSLRILTSQTMMTPNLDDSATADRLTTGTSFIVVQIPFLTIPEPEAGPETTLYWVPVERVGLP